MVKQILGFPNYLITHDSRVWSRKRDIYLKPYLNKGGYYWVRLCENGHYTNKKIHHLVLEMFVGCCPTGMQGCHNNGNSLDNRLENLRWDTPSNNHKDAVQHGTHNGLKCGEEKSYAKLKLCDIKTIVRMWETKLFKQKDIAKIYNMSKGQISLICNKNTWKHLWEE